MLWGQQMSRFVKEKRQNADETETVIILVPDILIWTLFPNVTKW